MPIPKQYRRMLASRGFGGLGTVLDSPLTRAGWSTPNTLRALDPTRWIYNGKIATMSPDRTSVSYEPITVATVGTQRISTRNPNAPRAMVALTDEEEIGIDVSPQNTLRWYSRLKQNNVWLPGGRYKRYTAGETSPPAGAWLSETEWRSANAPQAAPSTSATVVGSAALLAVNPFDVVSSAPSLTPVTEPTGGSIDWAAPGWEPAPVPQTSAPWIENGLIWREKVSYAGRGIFRDTTSVPITVQNVGSARIRLGKPSPYEGVNPTQIHIEVSPESRLRWSRGSIMGGTTYQSYMPGSKEPDPNTAWMTAQEWNAQRDQRVYAPEAAPTGATLMTPAQQSILTQLLAPSALVPPLGVTAAPNALIPVGATPPPVSVVDVTPMQFVQPQSSGAPTAALIGFGALALIAAALIVRR